ncbi:conserved exported hypothetical protein [uncultured delta proteobacterium]|uniref:DUF3179 domain-containing protein n=1 Tax=uncultured delta proteobacterium TaxID=34034 RepID=A0A212J9L2_9DELT|nr:conserved exported hypothetical protein [uncultured delta proteobacterium]
MNEHNRFLPPWARARKAGLSRKTAPLAVLAAFFLVLCCGLSPAKAAKLQVPPPPRPIYSNEMLEDMASRFTRTGVAMDAIPALYRPRYLSVSDASLSMEHDEAVFIVTYPTGLVRIYPQRIMVWHEVINDVLPDPEGGAIRADTPISALDAFIVTYSPLTGCVAAYYAVAGRFPSTFGVTGELLNSNTLIYDRMTASVWSQMTGTCIDGPQKGKRLSPIQVTWASWKGARDRYPDAQVLSRSTGHRRNYGRDPYGSYQRPGNYYDDLRLFHPLQRLDTRLPPKKRILGIEREGIAGAVQIDEVKNAGLLNMELGVTPIVAFYDTVLETVHLFERRAEGSDAVLTFSFLDGKIVDDKTKGEWTSEGVCTYGRLREKKLVPLLNTNAMWFSWSAFYPQTVILPEKSFVRPGL